MCSKTVPQKLWSPVDPTANVKSTFALSSMGRSETLDRASPFVSSVEAASVDNVSGAILLCGTGSLASINLPGCTSELLDKLHRPLHVILTRSALQFTTLRALRAMAKGRVWSSDFEDQTPDGSAPHVTLTNSAVLVIVYPATADFIARIAHGLADDLASTVVLCAGCPVIVAPTMHKRMWGNAATQANLQVLEDRGFFVLKPQDEPSQYGPPLGITFSVDTVIRKAQDVLLETHSRDTVLHLE